MAGPWDDFEQTPARGNAAVAADPWAEFDEWSDFEEQPAPVEDRSNLGPYRPGLSSADEPPSFMRSPLDAPQLPPGGGVTAPPLVNVDDRFLEAIFGPREQPQRVSAPLTPEQEADVDSKVTGLMNLAPPLTGARDFSNALLTDRALGPKLSDPGRASKLMPEITVTGTREKAPVDYRPIADFGDTLAAMPGTIGGRYNLKWIGAQELVASHDARKKFYQATFLPEIFNHVNQYNASLTDERDRINLDEDPLAIDLAKRIGIRPDQFTNDWPHIMAMSPEERAAYAEENRALIAEQDARLESLAKERQDVAAELQRTRPHFASEYSGNALFFDAANSLLADMLPSLAVGAVAGPEAGLATMGALTLPEQYATNKNEGMSDAKALFGALAQTAAEVVPEGGVMEVALKTATGKEMLRKVLGRMGEGKTGHIIGTTLSEAASEDITELINIGLDQGMFDKDVTFAEAMDRLARSALIGGLMGGGTGVLTTPLPEHLEIAEGVTDRPPQELPAATTADFADVFAGNRGGGFAAPQLPAQSDVQTPLPINERPAPYISSFDIVDQPATTGSPAPEAGGAVGPTAPSPLPQGTATTPPPESRPLAAALEQPAPPAPPAPQQPAPAPAPHAAPAVSPAPEPPAGGAAPTKRARKPKEPPPQQGALFGREGEVIDQPPPAPPKAPAQVAPPAAAEPKEEQPPPRNTGMLGEHAPEAVDQFNAMLNNPDVPQWTYDQHPDEKPEWRPLPNGFAARAYIIRHKNGALEPRQEVRAPSGDIATRGLDTQGTPFSEIEFTGTPDDLYKGKVTRQFAEYFAGKSQTTSAPQLTAPKAEAPQKKAETKPGELNLPPPPAPRMKGAKPTEKASEEMQLYAARAKKAWKEYQKITKTLRGEGKMYRIAKWDGLIADIVDRLGKAKTFAEYFATMDELSQQLDQAVDDAKNLEVRRKERASGNIPPLELPPPPATKGKPAKKIASQVESDSAATKELYAEYDRLRPAFEDERPAMAETNEERIGDALEDLHNAKSYRDYAAALAQLRDVLEKAVKVAQPQEARPLEPGRKFTPGMPFADVPADGKNSEPGNVVEMPTTNEGFAEAVAEHERLFAEPKETVRAIASTGPYLSPEEAARRIESWQAHAKAQNETAGNESRNLISVFDLTGHWSQPFEDAGYYVHRLDLQTGQDIRDFMAEPFEFLQDKLKFIGGGIDGILLAVPCTDFAASGARWWKEKDADGRTEASKDLVIASLKLVEMLEPRFWALENPVGRLPEMSGLPKATLTFQPNAFGDPYTKLTQLWGNFNPNLPTAPVEPTEGSKMHSKFGGSSLRTKNARSVTPQGFAAAFFMANNYADNAQKAGTPPAPKKAKKAKAPEPAAEKADAQVVPADRMEQKREEREAGRQGIQRAIDFMMAQISLLTNTWNDLRAKFTDDARAGKLEQEIEKATGEFTRANTDEAARDALERLRDKLEEGIAYLRTLAKKPRLVVDNAPTEAAADVEADETTGDELRRAKRVKSNREPGPFSMSREGEVRAAADNIWTDSGLDPDLMELATPQRRFQKAAELIKARFGFRDIQKDKNLNWGEAIDALKDAWIGLNNLAAVQNVNPEFMSLNGRLALKMHREFAGALAYYSPKELAIGVTRRNDAFAHEWAHALDHYLIETYAQDMLQSTPKGRHLTGKTRIGGTTQTLDQQVRDTFIDVLNAMYFDGAKAAAYVADLQNKIATAKTPKIAAKFQKLLDTFKAGHSKKQDIASEYYKAAKATDARSPEGDKEDSYWQRPTEMFARVYEAYIANKIASLPADHPFVTQSTRMYDESRIGTMRVPYPQQMDRDNIFAALDTMMRAMRDRGLAPTGNAPNAIEPTDTRYWSKAAPRLNSQAVQQARSVVQRLKAPFQRQLAEVHRADREERARDEQEKRIRDVKLANLPPGTARRWLANQGMKAKRIITELPAMIAHSIRGIMLSLRDKHKGNTGIAWLVQQFATDPGANIGVQGKVYSEEIRHREKDLQNRFAAIVKKHGIMSFDNTELRELRDVLVNVKSPTTVHPKIAAAAADVRRFMNDMYNYNASNGVNIGYAKNGYLPRVIDAMVVENDVQGFRTQAQKLYARVYPREVGSLDKILEDPLEHPERIRNLTQYVREIIKNGRVSEAVLLAKSMEADAKELNRALIKLKEAAESGADTEQLEERIAELTEKIYDGLQRPWSIEAANDWEQRIRNIGSAPEYAFDQRDPNSDYTKARILPEETDAIMGDYLKNDPLELITTYISHSVHRVEFGKFFGNPIKSEGKKLGWKLDEALAAANAPYRAANGSTQRISADEFEELQKSIDLLVGRYNTNMTKKGLRWKTRITALLTPVILARALWSQFAEPIVMARATGDFTDIMRVFYSQMQDLTAALGLKGAKAKAAWRREMSEYFGVVADHMADQVMLQRYNLMDLNSSDRVKMQRFFHIIGIHPHAVSMRRAASQIFMQRYAPKIAQRALGTGPKAKLARQALAELGLDASNQELLGELASLANIKTVQQLEKLRHIDQIRTAINRFTDSAIMEPKAIDKPRMASMPEYSYLYGIMSFQYAYSRHILIATGKRIANAWREDKSIGVAQATSAAANLTLLMAGQMAAYVVRSLLFSGDDPDELKKKMEEPQLGLPNWLWQSMSRSGMFGIADPLVNAFMGLKYERDLTQLMAGPMLALPLKLTQDITRSMMNDSPMTADAEYKLTEASWKMASIWATSKALSYAGAYPGVDVFMGIGLPFLTSNTLVEPIAEGVAELATGQEYVSPETKAAARAGDDDAQMEVDEAKMNNSADDDALLNEEIPDQE